MAPTFLKVSLGLSAVFSAISTVLAESHTVTFDNRCGTGTPTLILNGQVVSTGEPYTVQGGLNGIAYLQTGQCLFNGEECTLMEMNLANPSCPGCGSSVDISLISPHAFNVETSFAYYNGCDGQGRDCASSSCTTAFFNPDDWQVQVQCEVDDVDLLITFCGDATKLGLPGSDNAAPPPSTSAAASTSAPATTSAKPTSTSATHAPATTDAASSAPAKPTTSDAPSAPATSASTSAAAATASASTDAAPSVSTDAASTSAVATPSVSTETAAATSTAPASVSTDSAAPTATSTGVPNNVGVAEPSGTASVSSSAPAATATAASSTSGKCALKKRHMSSLVKKAEAVAAVAPPRRHNAQRHH